VSNFRHFAKNIFQLKYSVANSFPDSGKKNCQKNEKKTKKKSTKIHHNCLQPVFSFCGEILFQKMKNKKTDTHTIHLFVILGKTSPFF
jgi:hypothetical protein